MTIIFNQQSTNKAVLVKAIANGYIVAQGQAPYWLGQSRQGLEALLGTPPGGFNQEVRDGIYVDPAKIPGGIIWLPWSGECWVLNGTGVNDNQNNVVSVQPMSC